MDAVALPLPIYVPMMGRQGCADGECWRFTPQPHGMGQLTVMVGGYLPRRHARII